MHIFDAFNKVLHILIAVSLRNIVVWPRTGLCFVLLSCLGVLNEIGFGCVIENGPNAACFQNGGLSRLSHHLEHTTC